MIHLELMSFQEHLKLKKQEGKTYLFDPIRKKWILLQPEEMVRQLLLQYLLLEKAYNRNRIKVEKGLIVNSLYKRCDILVYDKKVNPWLLVECKRPDVPLTQDTFRQIASYNLPLQVKYLLVTNGRESYCCKMDYRDQTYEFVREVPLFEE